ncbi:MAG: DUF692 domain-containing protein [Alphaproteobacteria bacterium]
MPVSPPCGSVNGRSLPAVAGVGMRHPHIGDFLSGGQPVGWIEVHSENFVGDGGPDLAALLTIRRDLPVACHGVGLSLGSVDGVDDAHLALLGRLYDRLQPAVVSEHIAWTVGAGIYLNDLLPMPWTEEALSVVCRNVDAAQSRFRRRILVENPSTYLAFPQSTVPEWEFVSELARRTGCGLLLDVNNVYVSAHNLAFSAAEYLERIPHAAIDEIHLAGHSLCRRGTEVMRIDDHGSSVCDDVWALYASVLKRTGPVPTLIEWDTDIPALPVLLAEANAADRLLERHGKVLADVA